MSTEEAAAWRDAADDMYIPYDERLGVHPQHDGFTNYARWDFEVTSPEHYPLLLHYPYFQLYRKQVVKQADLVLAMQLRGDAFTPEQKLRNFDYYEALTVRDSSLSACTQAVMAAEVGHLDLAYDYLAEAAFMDLQDREHNTRDGLHIASLAGRLDRPRRRVRRHAASGQRPLASSPGSRRASPGSRSGMRYRGRILLVNVRHHDASYCLLAGDPLRHHPPRQPGHHRPGHGDPRHPAASSRARPPPSPPAAPPSPAKPWATPAASHPGQRHADQPSLRPCRVGLGGPSRDRAPLGVAISGRRRQRVPPEALRARTSAR